MSRAALPPLEPAAAHEYVRPLPSARVLLLIVSFHQGRPQRRRPCQQSRDSVRHINCVWQRGASTDSSALSELPPGWFESIHPSGYIYYCYLQARLHTRLDPRLPGVAERLLFGANQLLQALPPGAAAVQIEIAILAIQDDVVFYYMIDHAAHRILWAHEPAWADLGINEPHNHEHLRTLPSPFAIVLTETSTLVDQESRLAPYYWAHVEQYPDGAPDDVAAERRLKGILLSGLIPGKGLIGAQAERPAY